MLQVQINNSNYIQNPKMNMRLSMPLFLGYSSKA